MKKVSTATRKAIRNSSQPKLTIGLDLGDRSSWYCLLDEVGEILREQKLSTSSKAMREVFGGMPRSLQGAASRGTRAGKLRLRVRPIPPCVRDSARAK